MGQGDACVHCTAPRLKNSRIQGIRDKTHKFKMLNFEHFLNSRIGLKSDFNATAK